MKPHKLFILCFVAVFFCSFVLADDKEPPKARESAGVRQFEQGRIEQITPRSMSVRVGDATTTYTFDNKTIFTYGDQPGSARDLKIGEEVFVRGKKGKAIKVNATQRIEGVIEKIDTQQKKLTVKFGDAVKEIPFSFFWVSTPDGKFATVEDMKEGDAVILNVNMGLSQRR